MTRVLRRTPRPVAALLVALWVAAVAAPVADADDAKQRRYRAIITKSLRSAVDAERRAVAQLASASTVPEVGRGAKTAHAGYAQVRYALDRLETLAEMAAEKSPDPVLHLQEKQVDRAKTLVRLGLTEIEGAQSYQPQRVQRAIDHFRQAIQILEIVLAAMA